MEELRETVDSNLCSCTTSVRNISSVGILSWVLLYTQSVWLVGHLGGLVRVEWEGTG